MKQGRQQFTKGRRIRSLILFTLPLIFFLLIPSALGAQDGAALFKANCAACHSTGENRMVGPGLQGINAKRKPEWLLKWIRNSGEMIKGGDPDAKAIYEEFGKTLMPASVLSDDEIKSILKFLENPDAGKPVTAEVPAPVAPPADQGLSPLQFSFLVTAVLFFILYLTVYAVLARLNISMRAKGAIGIPALNVSYADRFLNWANEHRPVIIFSMLVVFAAASYGFWTVIASWF